MDEHKTLVEILRSGKMNSEFREQERLWAKDRHDEAQALSNAEEKGEIKAEKRIIELLKSGKSPEELIREFEAK